MQSMQTVISFGWGYNYKGVVSPQDTYNAKMTLPEKHHNQKYNSKECKKAYPLINSEIQGTS